MAEWSKAIDSSSIIFGCAGSNPAGTTLYIIFYILFYIIPNKVLWQSWLMRRAYNAEIVGSSPTRTIFSLLTF